VLFEKALQCFQDRGSIEGELLVRDKWWLYLYETHRTSELIEQRQEILALQDKATSPDDLALIAALEARHRFEIEQDFAGALKVLEPHQKYVAEHGCPDLQQRSLVFLGRSLFELGMSRRAFEVFELQAKLAKKDGMRRAEAWALSNSVVALREQVEESSRSEDREQAIEYVQRALSRLEELGFREQHASVLVHLAELRRDSTSDELYEECIDLTVGRSWLLYLYKVCRQKLAERQADLHPEDALRMVEELWSGLLSSRLSLLDEAYNQHNELRILWRAKQYDRAWDASRMVLDTIEDLRDVQSDSYGRSRSISAWAMTYPWIAGRLLRLYEEQNRLDYFDNAFRVVEQMRARVLLDLLETMEAVPPDTPELRKTREKRVEVVERINQLQRRLRLGLVSEGELPEVTVELDGLVARESSLQNEVHEISGRFADLERPDPATVSQVQAALQPYEAVLSFQLAPWESAVEEFAGGSWLLMITKNEIGAHHLPNSDEITQWVTALHGRLDQGASAPALVQRLYKELLAEALESLPDHITDLLVIPDKALHRLPFAVLHGEDTQPLGARFRLTRIPSATLWLNRWRKRTAPSPAPKSALVFADPYLGVQGGSTTRDWTRSSALLQGGGAVASLAEVYGPLPFSRQEAWGIRRQLGAGVEILTGAAASELSLESLNRFRIVHFAAHAVANEENPELAGVILAPKVSENGSQHSVTDGLLQFNEIVDLDIADCAVVLSTCHSARGQILRGEGVFDLARAFFEGGARAVVGSLWRLEDRATARFFDDFYRHLARGTSLSGALHLTQRDQIARGAPASAWAGIVVIGDGSLVPFPDRGGRHHPGWAIAVALIVLVVAAGVASRRTG